MNFIVKDHKSFASRTVFLILLTHIFFYFNLTITLAKDDVVPSQLTQFNFNPKSIETTLSSRTVTVNIAAFDARYGISSMIVTFSSPSGTQFRSMGVSGGGPALLKLDFPQFSESGAWGVAATLVNKAGNKTFLSIRDIHIAGFLNGLPDSLQVTSDSDNDATNFITAFDFNHKIIDTSFSDQIVKVALTAVNDDSDPQYKVRSSTIDFVSPSGQEMQSAIENGPGPDMQSIVFPQLSEPGIWQVVDITLVYANGDTAVLTTGDLSSSGFPTELLNGNTPLGKNGNIGIGNIAITFENVTRGGNTTIATSTEMFDYASLPEDQVASSTENVGLPGTMIATSTTLSTLPIGFTSGNPPFYFDATTTATVVGPIKVCINYDKTQFLDQEKNLKLFHLEDNQLVDVTTSLDTVKNMICGQVQDLSEFALLVPLSRAACISQYGSNAALVGNSCECNEGYLLSNSSYSCVPSDQYCKETLGPNSYTKISGASGFDARFSNGTCQCNEGYIIVSNLCILKETKKISIAKKGENIIKNEPIIQKRELKITKLKSAFASTTTIAKIDSVEIDEKKNFFYNLFDILLGFFKGR